MQRTQSRTRLISLLIILGLVVAACNTGGNSQSSQPIATDIPADAVRVLFTYGSEKDAWVKAVTEQFNASGTKTSEGKLIVVEAVPAGSVESGMDIVENRTEPGLWSPASRLTLPVVNDAWQAKSGKALVSDSECRDLVVSPTVIMMWKPMAEALGYPKSEIGWADLIALAKEPTGWASKGKPQWGRFRFGHTHPDFSNSGLQSIVAIAYAGAGKQRGLTVEDVEKDETKVFMRDIESAIAHYGRSTGFFGTAMAERGTAYLSAAVVYENVVIENNIDPLKSRNLEFPVVAIYPKEGTFLTDHPACIPDAPYMTPELREAAEIYRKFLLETPQQQRALEFGFRPADPTIALTAPFLAENGVDITQPKNTLAVPNGSVIRAIREIWGQTKRPVNLTMIFDTSGSMNENNRIRQAREGAAAFVDQLSDNDVLTLISFNSTSAIVFENLPVGPNRQKMKDDILSLTTGGGTALYDTIAEAIDRQQGRLNNDYINAIVVLTDGEDTNSTTYRTANELMNKYGATAESTVDISLFTIGYELSDKGNLELREIARRGRGAAVRGSGADIRQVYLEISTFF